ncbi:GNAT family N-acetyltransferase [Luteimonas sp. RIT-PG2_3]
MKPAVAPAAIVVEPVNDATASAVRRLQVRPGQQAFVGAACATLDETLHDPGSDAMVIACRQDTVSERDRIGRSKVVGFYRLDFAPIVIDGQSLGRDAVSLRSLMIDRHWQGRGVATHALAACCADLRTRHPGRRLLALAVHTANLPALQLYRRAGFVDTGSVLADTSTGLQRILLRRLDAQLPATARHVAGMGQWPP